MALLKAWMRGVTGFLPLARWAPGLVAFLLMPADVAAAAMPSGQVREYQVKAVFLFNFAQFVDWPPEADTAPGAPFVIGVLGEDPFGSILDEAVKGESIAGHPLEVRRFAGTAGLEACRMVFVSASEAGRLEEVLRALKDLPVLTVGDGEGFGLRGVMIRLVTDRGKVRFRINLTAAQRARLIISSKLLRAADIIQPGKKGS